MKLSAKAASVQDILPWRDLYRQEMNCQIVHDSPHSREGWTRPYVLLLGSTTAGYGSIAVGGPWKGKPAHGEIEMNVDEVSMLCWKIGDGFHEGRYRMLGIVFVSVAVPGR